MKYLKDIDYTNIDKGIEYLQKNKLNFYLDKDEITIFHVYWYGKLDRKQILCINSYLKTQNLSKTKLWVWLDYKTFTEENINLIPKHKNIEIKKYIPNEEAKGTLFEKNPHLNQDKYLKFRSDLARVIFLYKYGGVYFDLDMILIKNFDSLLNIEFCYSWSFEKKGNNGLLRLFKKSQNCIDLMNKYNRTVSPFNLLGQNFYLGYNKIIFTDDINLYCLPCVLFDPVWILFDTNKTSKYSKLNNFDNFFKKTNEDINKFFNNKIYAYHWHSRNNYFIEKDSYFNKLENIK